MRAGVLFLCLSYVNDYKYNEYSAINGNEKK